MARLAKLAEKFPDELDRTAKLNQWNQVRGIARGVDKGGIPLRFERDPEYREFWTRIEDRGSWGGDAGKGCNAAPTTPWKVRAPRARGYSFFEVLSEYLENKIVALKNLYMQKWEDKFIDMPAWMRAEALIGDLSDADINPEEHGLRGITTLLSCAPGPSEGVEALQKVTEQQVKDAIKDRGLEEVSEETLTQLTQFLNSDHAVWIYFSVLDVLCWPKGAHLAGEVPKMQVKGGNIHLGDSGMLCHAKKTKRNVFEVIDKDLNFRFPGIDVIVQGGFRPTDWIKAISMRDSRLYSPSDIKLYRRPMFGHFMTKEAPDKTRTYLDPVSQLNFDMGFSIEYEPGNNVFAHIPRVPGGKPKEIRREPERIQIPDVTAPHYEPVGHHTTQFEPISVTSPGASRSGGFTPFVQSKEQQHIYVETADGGVSAAVGPTAEATVSGGV